jgi:hypothetical protein
VPCLGGQIFFSGGFQGNTFNGIAVWGDPEFHAMNGTRYGSSLEITIFDEAASGAGPIGQLHLHQ